MRYYLSKFLTFIILSLSLTTASAKSFGTIANEVENMIYETFPKDQGTTLFNKAKDYAIQYLTSDALTNSQQEFSNDFAKSYVNRFMQDVGESLKKYVTMQDEQSFVEEISKAAVNILQANNIKYQNVISNTLPQCMQEIKSDMLILMAVGNENTFTAQTTMPNTHDCILEKTHLKQLFSQDLTPYKEDFGKLLIENLKRLAQGKSE